jgi:hypothetical protein
MGGLIAARRALLLNPVIEIRTRTTTALLWKSDFKSKALEPVTVYCCRSSLTDLDKYLN